MIDQLDLTNDPDKNHLYTPILMALTERSPDRAWEVFNKLPEQTQLNNISAILFSAPHTSPERTHELAEQLTNPAARAMALIQAEIMQYPTDTIKVLNNIHALPADHRMDILMQVIGSTSPDKVATINDWLSQTDLLNSDELNMAIEFVRQYQLGNFPGGPVYVEQPYVE